MPYTALKRLSTQSALTNPGTWGAGGTTGDDINTGICSPIDTALAGISAISLSSSNYSLTFTAGGGGDVNNCYWKFTGTLTANIVVSPTAGDATTYFNGFYFWNNATTGSFTVTLTTSNGSLLLPQGRSGVLFVNNTNLIAPVMISGGNGDIVSGSKTIFYNTAAPTGWTAVALNDYGIKIVTTGSGGVTSGSIAYSTAFGSATTGSHTLTSDEIPSHTHNLFNNGNVSATRITTTTEYATTVGEYNNADDYWIAATTQSANPVGLSFPTGGGNGHTHTLDLQVLTAAFTLCSRD